VGGGVAEAEDAPQPSALCRCLRHPQQNTQPPNPYNHPHLHTQCATIQTTVLSASGLLLWLSRGASDDSGYGLLG